MLAYIHKLYFYNELINSHITHIYVIIILLMFVYLYEFFKEWQTIKKGLMSYLVKMRNSWDKETSMEEDLGYFG